METVPTVVLVNGGGEFAVQATGLESDAKYFLQVEAADPGGLFDTGNYSLVVVYDTVPTQLDVLASGTVATIDQVNSHRLYVARPQLFHLLLQAGDVATTVPMAVAAVILDSQGQPLARLTAQPGETRSETAVLLQPGTYTVDVRSLSLNFAATPPVDYQILGAAISDPFVGDPNDPTQHPFACDDPDLTGFFCYPGDFHSPDPYLWDDFVDTRIDPATNENPLDTLTDLFAGWWSWVWGQTGTNGPTFANPDHIRLTSPGAGSGLVPLNVLANDVDPEGDALVAVLVTGVSHGTLTLNPNGSFEYIPGVGFNGIDSFTYRAFDFFQESNDAIVTVAVGELLAGDYDGDGSVNPVDLAVWKANYGSRAALAADGNQDGIVNGADYVIWRNNLDVTFGTTGTSQFLTIQEVIPTVPVLSTIDMRTLVSVNVLSPPRPQLAEDNAHETKSIANRDVSPARVTPQSLLTVIAASAGRNEFKVDSVRREPLQKSHSPRNHVADAAFAIWEEFRPGDVFFARRPALSGRLSQP
jgi:hypothetical protein